MHLLTNEENEVLPLQQRYLATEKAEVLCFTADGLLSRLSSLSLKLANKEIGPLVNPDWKKIVDIIDKNFMDDKLPTDLTTLPNYQKFKEAADLVEKELVDSFVLIIETIELTKACQKVLEALLNRSSGTSLLKAPQSHSVVMELIIY